MKASATKRAQKPQTPVLQTAIHKPGATPKAVTPNSESQKQVKIFSKSRATREGRGSPQMKTTLDPQVLFSLCGHLSP